MIIVIKCSKCGEVKTLDTKKIKTLSKYPKSKGIGFIMKPENAWDYVICEKCPEDLPKGGTRYNAGFIVQDKDMPYLVAKVV